MFSLPLGYLLTVTVLACVFFNCHYYLCVWDVLKLLLHYKYDYFLCVLISPYRYGDRFLHVYMWPGLTLPLVSCLGIVSIQP